MQFRAMSRLHSSLLVVICARSSFATRPSDPRSCTVAQAVSPSGSRRRAGNTSLGPSTTSSSAFRRSRSGSGRRSRERSRRQSKAIKSGGVASSAPGVHQKMELAHQLCVEDAHFAVEDERARRQPRDSGGDVGKARGVVTTAPTNKAHTTTVLERERCATVVLLLVHPARPVERLRAAWVDQVDGGSSKHFAGSIVVPRAALSEQLFPEHIRSFLPIAPANTEVLGTPL